MKKYHGVFPALYPCYDSQGRIAPQALRRLARWLMQSGVSGLYLNSPAGNNTLLTVREKIEIMENVMAEAEGRILVLCEVSCENIEDTLELCRHAAACGADAAVSHPCGGQEDALSFWRTVADMAAEADTIFCDVPFPKTDPEKERFLRFAKDTRLRGVIPVRSELASIGAWRALLPENVSIFTSEEKTLSDAIALGADALAGAYCTAAPTLAVRLESSLRYVGAHRAVSDQADMAKICGLLESCEMPLEAARAMLRCASGLEIGTRRPPLSEEDLAHVCDACAVVKGSGL